jgi:hypothetical protein
MCLNTYGGDAAKLKRAHPMTHLNAVKTGAVGMKRTRKRVEEALEEGSPTAPAPVGISKLEVYALLVDNPTVAGQGDDAGEVGVGEIRGMTDEQGEGERLGVREMNGEREQGVAMPAFPGQLPRILVKRGRGGAGKEQKEREESHGR